MLDACSGRIPSSSNAASPEESRAARKYSCARGCAIQYVNEQDLARIGPLDRERKPVVGRQHIRRIDADLAPAESVGRLER